MKQLTESLPAPDFTLEMLDGRAFRLSEALAAAPIVLVFYKASCPTCQFTFPYLQRIHAGGHPMMKIVAVSQDDNAETREFVERLGIGFDILLDEHPFDVSMAYGVEYVPSIFIIRTDGAIQLSDYGFSKATLSEIAKPLELFRPDDGIPATRPG